MSYGEIWIYPQRQSSSNQSCSTSQIEASSTDKQQTESENAVLVLGHEGEMKKVADPSIRLSAGEIAVIGCVSSPILPLVNLNLRTPDVNLRPGEYVTVRGRNAFGQITSRADFYCKTKDRLKTTRDLNLTEFVVITCDRPLPAAAEESGNTDVGETSDGEEADEAREYDENDQAQEHEQAESEDALAVVDEYDPEDDEMFEE